MNPKIKTTDQLRASVIVHWLKLYNLRKVQVMAGHRYISTTEGYRANNLEDLKEDIRSYIRSERRKNKTGQYHSPYHQQCNYH